MHYPTDRITHTTAFVTPVVEHWLEREIAQWATRGIQEYIECCKTLTAPRPSTRQHASWLTTTNKGKYN